jgi:hypothetical protein
MSWGGLRTQQIPLFAKSIFSHLPILAMKKSILLMLMALSALGMLAQGTTEEDTSYWEKGGVLSLGFTNTGYSEYWQAGGLPSQSLLVQINLFLNHEKGRNNWENDLNMSYGLIRQGSGPVDSVPFIKNQDRIELSSKYGYRFQKNLLLATNLNFRTQFAPGFRVNPDQPTALPTDTISDFLAPAYLNFGVGLDFKPSKNFSVYYSPVNSKVTIVTNENFRATYIPIPEGDTVAPGVRYELGSNLTIKLRHELAQNITFSTTGNFFANYLENFGNIDVNWETLTTAKVNNWLAVTFTTNLIYDDDIRFEIVDEQGASLGYQGPRTQFQHVLSIGLTYNFL